MSAVKAERAAKAAADRRRPDMRKLAERIRDALELAAVAILLGIIGILWDDFDE